MRSENNKPKNLRLSPNFTPNQTPTPFCLSEPLCLPPFSTVGSLASRIGG